MGDDRLVELIGSIQKLAVTSEALAAAVMEMLRKQEEDRIEAKERQRQYDEEREDFQQRQRKWDRADWWMANPWLCPQQIMQLLMVLACTAAAITGCNAVKPP